MIGEDVTVALNADVVRLFLHMLAASIWVGGQFVMLGVLEPARKIGSLAMYRLCKMLAWLSWPALAVLVVTGIWNIMMFNGEPKSTAWTVVLWAKVGLVILAGLSAWLHGKIAVKWETETLAAVGTVSSVLALIFGVMLAG
ncbi:MAG: hypothetical protein WCI26_09425 [Acidimicrobiales bacterium]